MHYHFLHSELKQEHPGVWTETRGRNENKGKTPLPKLILSHPVLSYLLSYSKMETILNTGTKLDVKWKYLTGEWFYEAKSRRHMDKIHGSDIILASMKQQRSPLGVSVRTALLTHG